MKKLQLVQNFSARIPAGLKKFDRISSALSNFGLPLVKDLFAYHKHIIIEKKNALIVYFVAIVLET